MGYHEGDVHRFLFFCGVARFRRQASGIMEVAKECEDKDDAMELYAGIYDLLREVQGCLDVAQARILELTPRSEQFQDYPLDSGVLKFGGGKERDRFDQDALISRYSSELAGSVKSELEIAHIVNMDGEEQVGRWPVIVHAIVRKFAEAVGATAPSFNQWRSGIAKEFGIKLNDYSTRVDTPVTVRIEGRDRRN